MQIKNQKKTWGHNALNKYNFINRFFSSYIIEIFFLELLTVLFLFCILIFRLRNNQKIEM